MSKHVVEEAKRCLNCKKPQCSLKGCPVQTAIPEVIQLLLNGAIEEAGHILFENNPLSLVCSYVCPHERQCEGNCILGKKGTSVQVSTIETYISEYYINLKREKIKPYREKIAIIGAGPAGLTISLILAQKGYDITLFESKSQIGGVLRYGIPEFRLPKKVLESIKTYLLNMGIKVRPNTLIGQGGITIDDLFRDGYEAIFIGTGVWKPKSLSMKGESLGHVHFAINYLKSPDAFDLGERVIIIGSGNVAMDVARTAIRKGVTSVTIFSLMDEEHLTANKYDTEYALIEGVTIEYCKMPIEIVEEGVVFADTQVENETPEAIRIEGSEKLYKADSVIISISQGPRSNIVSTTSGIDVGDKGLIITNQNGETTREGVYASGDVVTGARTVVEAVLVSKRVASAMEAYIEGKRD